MYELVQVGEKTYYIDCPTKIGIYLEDEQNAWLIDSGNSRDMGKRIDKILQQKQWQLKGIISTHAHADHIGGNHYLQEKYGCPVYAGPLEQYIVNHPEMKLTYLYGGFPGKDLYNRFLYAQPSLCGNIYEAVLPEGLELLPLPGHSMEMIGVKTEDGICFLADAIASKKVMEKYHIIFLYDIENYLATLDNIGAIDSKLFIPAHAEVCDRLQLQQVLQQNRENLQEVQQLILQLCKTPISFEILLQKIFRHYQLRIDVNQWVLVGFTIKSYLAYLKNKDLLDLQFVDCMGLWQSK